MRGLMQAGTHAVHKTWSTRGEDNIVHDVIVYLNPIKVHSSLSTLQYYQVRTAMEKEEHMTTVIHRGGARRVCLGYERTEMISTHEGGGRTKE